MTTAWYSYLILFAASGFIVSLLTPKIRNFAIKKSIVDRPNSPHKTHLIPIPYLGGLAIVLGVTITLLPATLFLESKSTQLLLSILIPAILLSMMGLIDDLKNLNPLPRFLFQNVVAFFSALFLVNSNTVGSPSGIMILDMILTVLFIVGICNSINFFDNVDGGAAGTVAISSITIFFLSIQSGQFYIASTAVVLAGGTFSFLWWNRSPARIYMGDAGSLFLGALLAALLIRFDPIPINQGASFFVPLFLVAIPILDTSVSVFSRLSRGVSPFTGGKDHLSHRLIEKGLQKKSAVFLLWGLTGYFAFLAVLLSLAPFRIEYLVVLLGIISWIVAFIAFSKLKIAK
jgi:UDP-GlcNAc:undecaprenyl-phosphate GlcNAc-1-phosphate transferase